MMFLRGIQWIQWRRAVTVWWRTICSTPVMVWSILRKLQSRLLRLMEGTSVSRPQMAANHSGLNWCKPKDQPCHKKKTTSRLSSRRTWLMSQIVARACSNSVTVCRSKLSIIKSNDPSLKHKEGEELCSCLMRHQVLRRIGGLHLRTYRSIRTSTRRVTDHITAMRFKFKHRHREEEPRTSTLVITWAMGKVKTCKSNLNKKVRKNFRYLLLRHLSRNLQVGTLHLLMIWVEIQALKMIMKMKD